MNTLSGSTIFFIPLILVLLTINQPAQANDWNQPQRFGQKAVSLEDGTQESQRPGQRGMFQRRDNRLAFQLDDLSEDQREQIEVLGREHRENMLELRGKMRNGEISRESFQTERRANYENHQQELKKVLTEAQWQQLKKLRAERRRSGRNG